MLDEIKLSRELIDWLKDEHQSIDKDKNRKLLKWVIEKGNERDKGLVFKIMKDDVDSSVFKKALDWLVAQNAGKVIGNLIKKQRIDEEDIVMIVRKAGKDGKMDIFKEFCEYLIEDHDLEWLVGQDRAKTLI